MITKPTQLKGGFTLVELLVSIVLMTIVLAALTYFMSQIYGVYRSVTSESKVDAVANTLVQILTTEMRTGNAIDQSESVFNVPYGVLTIDAKDGTTDVVKRFEIVDGRVRYTEGGTTTFLTPDNIIVSKFLFTQLATPLSYAVRFEIDLTYTKDDALETKTYPGLVILRHSYD